MAKISGYAELTTPASGDLVPIVDVSDTSMAATGTTKFIEYGNMQTADVTTAPTLSSGTTAPTSTPGKVGDLYVDTTAPNLYFAVGTTDSDDWALVESSDSGGSVTLYHEGTFASTVSQGDNASAWRCPQSATLVSLTIWCDTAPSTASITCDLHKDGTTVFAGGTERPVIATSSTSDVSGAPSVTTMAAGDLFQVQVDSLNASDEGNIGQLMYQIAYTVSV